MSTPEISGGTSRLSPADRETFFRAQRRNRRATWRMTALCAFAAMLMGIPLTLVLTPFLYAITMAVAEIVNSFSPLAPAFWQTTGDLAKLAYRVIDVGINQRGTLNQQELVVGLLLLLLPGVVFALALWLGVLLMFRRGGVGGTLATLNAREPNRADLRELQLADTVQEMAIAAGLPSPKAMLIDSSGANAAAIGTCPADAHIVVSRRLLDDLDRSQLQALIGHLVASVGNGDLHIAFTVTSVFETCGLIITLINAPFGKQSRSVLSRIIRYLFRGGAGSRAAEADDVAELLADMMEMDSTDIDRFFNSRNPGLIRKFLRLLFFPFLFTNIAVEITLWFFVNLLLSPCMALLWRTRRYLADAGAVEFTRNPDALASALQCLGSDKSAVEGGGWATHLFVVNPEGDRSLGDFKPTPEQQRAALAAWQKSLAAPGSIPSSEAANEYSLLRKEIMSTALAASTGNTEAMARIQAFAQMMGGASELGLHDMPNANDIILAQQGDRAAMTRLRLLRQAKHQESPSKSGRTGLQSHSMISFHPPLKKRAKRLQKMGAHLAMPTRNRGGVALVVFFAFLYLIIVPLLTVAAALMLLVIAMMIGLNLLFLTLWLSVIHWAFAQDWPGIIRALVGFVEQLAAAINKSR